MAKRKTKGVELRQRTFGYVRVPRKGKRLGRRASKDSGVSHVQRPELKESVPMHVTLKVVQGLESLRCTAAFLVIAEAVRRANAVGYMRIVQFSVQGDHVHMICEAANNNAMAKGMNGLSIRVARGFNRLLGRTGKLFADRYHRQDLDSPRRVRNVIRYVLQNVFKHLSHLTEIEGMDGKPAPDSLSSGPWFDRWKEGCRRGSFWENLAKPTAEARSWLLRFGWHQGGALSLAERPA